MSDSLHSSIVEGTKPNGGCQQVNGDHHLSVLFKGFLEPLEQADGLVLQGVHLCRTRNTFSSPLVLSCRRGAGLGSVLWGLLLGLMCRSVEGRRRQPPLAGGLQRRRAESAAPHQHGGLEGGGSDRARRCHPPQSTLSEYTPDYHPARPPNPPPLG